MQPTEPFRIDRAPSVPPNMSWPMVAYKFVVLLPACLVVVASATVAIVLLLRAPGGELPAILTVLVGGQASGLIRSKPVEESGR